MTIKNYRVAASCFEPDPTQAIDARRQALCEHVNKLLAEHRPALLILPETVIVPDFNSLDGCGAEPIDGPTVTMMSELSRSFSVNICIPIIEMDGAVLYNSAVYVDKSGNIAGTYRKHVPTCMETEHGIRSPKLGQQPILLDGLRVGTAICFDQHYPDLIWSCIAAGVDLMVFPAYTYAGDHMRNWAFNCGVPLICAFAWESIIYDRDGSILAQAGTMTDQVRFGHHPAWIACNLNFQSRIYHLDGNQEKLKQLAARYGGKVDVRLMVRDARMMITMTADDLEIDEVERQVGLVPLQQYLRDSRMQSEQA